MLFRRVHKEPGEYNNKYIHYRERERDREATIVWAAGIPTCAAAHQTTATTSLWKREEENRNRTTNCFRSVGVFLLFLSCRRHPPSNSQRLTYSHNTSQPRDSPSVVGNCVQSGVGNIQWRDAAGPSPFTRPLKRDICVAGPILRWFMRVRPAMATAIDCAAAAAFGIDGSNRPIGEENMSSRAFACVISSCLSRPIHVSLYPTRGIANLFLSECYTAAVGRCLVLINC